MIGPVVDVVDKDHLIPTQVLIHMKAATGKHTFTSYTHKKMFTVPNTRQYTGTCPCCKSITMFRQSLIFSCSRGNSWAGPLQKLPLETEIFVGQGYIFSGYVKLLPGPSSAPQTFYLTLRYTKQGNITESLSTIV